MKNTDWVEQLASSSGKHQKRSTDLIDLHLGKLVQSGNITEPVDDLKGFDIEKFIG